MLFKNGLSIKSAAGKNSGFKLRVNRPFQEFHQSILGFEEDIQTTLTWLKSPQISATDKVNYINKAVMQGAVDKVKAIVEAGADVKDVNVKTEALVMAAFCGLHDMITFLVGKGADVNAMCLGNYTAISMAILQEHTQCVNILIEAGADVNVANVSNGTTPLMDAAYRPNAEAIDLIIKKGADVNMTSHDGSTALILASAIQQDVILPQGTEVNSKKYRNRVRRLLSSLKGTTECISLLLQSGADVNKADDHGRTALILAAKQYNPKSIDLLLQAGADVNTPANYGNTPLMEATISGQLFTVNLRCMKLLLIAGARVNIINEVGQNAMKYHLAESSFISEDIMFLLFVAGETIDVATVDRYDADSEYGARVDVADYLPKIEPDSLDLKHICRETIRAQLIISNPHESMFTKIPKLNLPSSLEEYLLYDVELDKHLEEEDDEEEEDSDEDEDGDDEDEGEGDNDNDDDDNEDNFDPYEFNETEDIDRIILAKGTWPVPAHLENPKL